MSSYNNKKEEEIKAHMKLPMVKDHVFIVVAKPKQTKKTSLISFPKDREIMENNHHQTLFVECKHIINDDN